MTSDSEILDAQTAAAQLTPQIDKLCDEFEALLRDGQLPAIEPFLEQVGPPERTSLLRELAFLCLEHLNNQGVSKPIERILATYKELAEELNTILVECESTIDMRREQRRRNSLQLGSCSNCSQPVWFYPNSGNVESCRSCGAPFLTAGSESTTSESATAAIEIDHFQLMLHVGAGGFGSVWKARDKKLNRNVAIKYLHSHIYGSPEDASIQEASNFAHLTHPGIVNVHETGIIGDTTYIVSEFVDGMTLAEWMKNNSVSSIAIAELGAKIADALHFAHEHDVVHRDLKPGNIMIDVADAPRIMDFGLARRGSASDANLKVIGPMGTLHFMSPEQALGRGETAERQTDIYSFGVILFQLLTGELPFRGDKLRVLHQITHKPPPDPSSLNAKVPRDMETIVLRCMEKSPSARLQTAAEVAEELRRFRAGVPIISRPISRVERAWRWSMRHKPVSAAALAATLLLVGWLVRERIHNQSLGRQLRETLMRTAELHGTKGEWEESAVLLQEAEKYGLGDPIALSLAKIRTYDALNRKLPAQRELERLAQRPDLGLAEAKVQMLQGMSKLASDGQAAALPYFQRAQNLPGLSFADQRLVESMLADTSAEAVRLLKAAVAKDPYHQEARLHLILMLSSLGRTSDAELEAKAGRAFFPDDPNFVMLLASLAASEGRLDEMNRYFSAPCMRQLNEEHLEAYRKTLSTLSRYQTSATNFWDLSNTFGIDYEILRDPQVQQTLFADTLGVSKGARDKAMDELVTHVLKLNDLIYTSNEDGQRVVDAPEKRAKSFLLGGIADHGPRCIAIAYQPLARIFSLRTFTFLTQKKGNVEAIDQLIRRLEVSDDAHPDSFLSFTRGQLLYIRGRISEAAEAFAIASTQHTSFGDYRAVSLFAAARCYYEKYKQLNDVDALSRASDFMRQRLSEGNLSRMHAEALLEIALDIHEYNSGRELLAIAGRLGLPTEQRLLRLARLELAAGEYQTALRHSQELLQTGAYIAEAKAISAECVDSLFQIVSEARDKSTEALD